MAALISSLIGVLFASAVYLVLARRSFSVILGLTLAAYGTNLFLLATGKVGDLAPPIITEGIAAYADPLPQALVLTAIVIGFGMTAFLIVLSLRASFATGTDHVDGQERDDVYEQEFSGVDGQDRVATIRAERIRRGAATKERSQ